jgi:hypothetical protein
MYIYKGAFSAEYLRGGILINQVFKKRKHRATSCYPMFSGGEKKLFITSFVIGNDIIAL